MTSPLRIRPVTPGSVAEIDRLIEVCHLTGDAGNDASHLHNERRLLGEVYVAAYATLHPELTFVIVDSDDQILGYTVGALDSLNFDRELNESWWPVLRERYPLVAPTDQEIQRTPNDQQLIESVHSWSGSNPEFCRDYPSHLHINLLPGAQGGGNGKRLLVTLFDALQAQGSTGSHLGSNPVNLNAFGFYTHIGFSVLEHTKDSLTLGMKFTM